MDDIFAMVSLAAVGALAAARVSLRFVAAGSALSRWAREVVDWQGYIVVLVAIAVFRICFYEMFWIPSASMQPTLRKGEFVVVDKNDFGIRVPLLDVKMGHFSEPERGQIVVFRYPEQDDIFYIKRIIGLPGDRLTIDGNAVALNGEKLGYTGPAETSYVYSEDESKSVWQGLVDLVTFAEGKKVASQLYWEKLPEVGWHSFLLADPTVSPVGGIDRRTCKASDGGRTVECVIPEESYFVMGDNRHRSNDSRFWGYVPRSLLVGPAFSVAISFDQLGRSFLSLALSEQAAPVDGLEPPQRGEGGI